MRVYTRIELFWRKIWKYISRALKTCSYPVISIVRNNLKCGKNPIQTYFSMFTVIKEQPLSSVLEKLPNNFIIHKVVCYAAIKNV